MYYGLLILMTFMFHSCLPSLIPTKKADTWILQFHYAQLQSA